MDLWIAYLSLLMALLQRPSTCLCLHFSTYFQSSASAWGHSSLQAHLQLVCHTTVCSRRGKMAALVLSSDPFKQFPPDFLPCPIAEQAGNVPARVWLVVPSPLCCVVSSPLPTGFALPVAAFRISRGTCQCNRSGGHLPRTPVLRGAGSQSGASIDVNYPTKLANAVAPSGCSKIIF
jgi:hypothetical protein